MELQLRRSLIALTALVCLSSVYSDASDDNDPWFNMAGTWTPDAKVVAAMKAAFYPVFEREMNHAVFGNPIKYWFQYRGVGGPRPLGFPWDGQDRRIQIEGIRFPVVDQDMPRFDAVIMEWGCKISAVYFPGERTLREFKRQGMGCHPRL